LNRVHTGALLELVLQRVGLVDERVRRRGGFQFAVTISKVIPAYSAPGTASIAAKQMSSSSSLTSNGSRSSATSAIDRETADEGSATAESPC
jgi:hypothetical protein